MSNLVIAPNPGQQTKYVESGVYEVMFGGGKKSGKTKGSGMLPLRYVVDPRFRCLILRKETPDLAYIEDTCWQMYRAVCPTVNYNQQKRLFTFPTPDGEPWGAQIRLGFCSHPRDLENYQGWKIQMAIFDELPQWETPDIYLTVAAELFAELDEDTGQPWMRPLLRATGNPGGPGHTWVKKRFCIDRFPDGEQLILDENTNQYRMYIKGTASDNPTIDFNDYLKRLGSLAPWKRKAYAEGNWNIKQGCCYEEWDSSIHEVEEFEIPDHWPIDVSIDYGYSHRSAVLYWATNPDNGATICIDEICVRKHTGTMLAHKMLDLETRRGYKVRNRIIDPSTKNTEGSGGRCVYRDMWEIGVICRLANNDRIEGTLVMHDMLTTMVDLPDGRTIPMLRFMKGRCDTAIESIPSVQRKENEDDVDKSKGNDDEADSARYHVMSLKREMPQSIEERYRPDEFDMPSADFTPFDHSSSYGAKGY